MSNKKSEQLTIAVKLFKSSTDKQGFHKITLATTLPGNYHKTGKKSA